MLLRQFLEADVEEKLGFEIDFMSVGTGEKNGDAIAIRFGTPGNYKVLVYDGGTQESGASLVAHIRKSYQTERVDYVVNSHPDRDHASGLSVVLEELEVGELWMHQPWKYSAEIRDYFHDRRITDQSLADRLQAKMAAAYKLEQLAEEKGVKVCEPFEGAIIGGYFQVLSPGEDWYVHTLVPEFEKSPALKKAALEAYDSLSSLFKSALEKAREWVEENWHLETLSENVCTSSENESSVVLFASIAGKGILLTGDAGVRALDRAAEFAESRGIDLPNSITFAQIPHHGSRHNVSPSVLNRLLGAPRAQTDKTRGSAYASVAPNCSTHPRPTVSNAFIRRGFKVRKTSGETIRHYYQMPAREGWSTATDYISFSEKVEA
jgi:beta-lactamase superfamily II metal-dependent hydrolase